MLPNSSRYRTYSGKSNPEKPVKPQLLRANVKNSKLLGVLFVSFVGLKPEVAVHCLITASRIAPLALLIALACIKTTQQV